VLFLRNVLTFNDSRLTDQGHSPAAGEGKDIPGHGLQNLRIDRSAVSVGDESVGGLHR